MSADKRTVSTDALETLGTIIGPHEKRDAIHLAVLPAVAGERLHRAEHIGIVDGKAYPDKLGLGIVDPFLAQPVDEGEHFWMVLQPRIITSLRHVWSHPMFPEPEDDAVERHGLSVVEFNKAREQLEAIAASCDIDADEMLAGAQAFLDLGDYMTEGGRWEGVTVPDSFWPVFEQLTGRKVPSSSRDNFFSCSC